MEPPFLKHVPVRGVSFRDDAVKAKARALSVGDKLDADRMPNNPYDSNAVRVYLPGVPGWPGRHCGYLGREFAAMIASHMDGGVPYHAVVVGFTKHWIMVDMVPGPKVEVENVDVVLETEEVTEEETSAEPEKVLETW